MNLLLTGAYLYSKKEQQVFKNMRYVISFQKDEFEITKNPEKCDVVIYNNCFINNPIFQKKSGMVIWNYLSKSIGGIDR